MRSLRPALAILAARQASTQVSDQVGGTIVTLLEAQGTPEDLARVDHPKIALEETI